MARKGCIMEKMLTGMKTVIEIAAEHGYDNLLLRRAKNLIQGAGEVLWRDDVQTALGDELYLLTGKYARKAFAKSKFHPPPTMSERKLAELRAALENTRSDRDAKSRQVQEYRDSLEKTRSDRDAKSRQVKEFRDALEKTRVDRDAISQKNRELKEAIAKTRADRDAISIKCQELRAALLKTRDDRDAISQKLQNFRAVNVHLKETIRDMTALRNANEVQARKLQQELVTLRRELAGIVSVVES